MIILLNYVRVWTLGFVLCFVSLVHSGSNNDGYISQSYQNSLDICSTNSNGHRIYLELGDTGFLGASNVTVPNNNNRSDSNKTPIITSPHKQYYCSLELVTCPACKIKITISFMNFTNQQNCESNTTEENGCKCDYLFFSERPYDGNMFGQTVCGNKQSLFYSSQTRSISIVFFYRINHLNDVFKLSYVSQRNKEEIIGHIPNATAIRMPQHKTMSSPFFPALYPQDFIREHLIVCDTGLTFSKRQNSTSSGNSVVNTLPPSNTCRIRVIFTDFQLALSSTMEIYDWNGQQIDVFSGAIFRPPIILSTGPTMLFRFSANGGIAVGYRADISFFLDTKTRNINQPLTTCGGFVDTLGGAITMMNMVQNDTETKRFDCIWLIRPSTNYLHLKTHLSLRVDSFNSFASNTKLIIRQGLTSNHPDLDTINYSQFNPTPLKTYVVPIQTGFYVSFNGGFGSISRLALVYTAFSYRDCLIGSELLCENQKCIPIQLQCDGFDHCGDNSDEPESCKSEWERDPFDRRWYSHTPNYYFPKMDRYPDLKTATMIFFISSIGLIFLISTLIILLYKMGNRARQQRELQSHLLTISELLDNSSRQEELPVEEPPAYEAPPEYDEVIKVGMEDEMNRKCCEQQTGRRRSRSSHSRSRRASHNYQNAILEVALPPETPTSSMFLLEGVSPSPTPTSNTPINGIQLLLSPFEEALIHRCNLETSTPSTSTRNSKGCQTQSIIPESPPPIYRQQSNTPITIVIDSSDSEQIMTPNQSTLYFKNLNEDLMDVSFSLESPINISRNLHHENQATPMWTNQQAVQTTWLSFCSDQPLAEQLSKTISVNNMIMEDAVDFVDSNEKEITNNIIDSTLADNLHVESSMDAIKIPKKYCFPINMFSSVGDLRSAVAQDEPSLKEITDVAASDLALTNNCIECGGQKYQNYELFSFGNFKMFGNKVQVMCQCSSANNFNQCKKRSLMMRRSSSAENFPLLLSRRKVSIQNSLTDALDLKLD